jgi:hypothetical protein
MNGNTPGLVESYIELYPLRKGFEDNICISSKVLDKLVLIQETTIAFLEVVRQVPVI